MNIGEASKASGVSAKMIRYYEDVGLIPVASRSDSGYRAYIQNDVHRLRFIRRARDLGFSVAEIRELLSLWNDGSRQSADVKRLAQAHIAELEEKIKNMRQMADTLHELARGCAGDKRPKCPILAALENPQEDKVTIEGHRWMAARTRLRGKSPT
ncbi:MAG: Cu(I)-responsive transcriptional regulator [Pseudomonadota bacterium]|nr:Cu(I)-responsive transcriptional regulator [Pseudomonadota bacterium]